MKTVYVNQQKVQLRANQAIAKGGEADIFQLDSQTVLKLFKPTDHPDYQGQSQEQETARERLAVMQHKLPQFPRQLPNRVIVPSDLVSNSLKQGKIIGYTMPFLQNAAVLLRYSHPGFCRDRQRVVNIFQDLYDTVAKLHFADVVIGDFNDLNVLVKGDQAYLIDADSFQFGSFPCKVFTARFVDPLLCDPKATSPLLQQAYNSDSDWYAFTVMLMQSLLFVDPYGGVYKPTKSNPKIPQGARSLHRITVFHPNVKYPKPATHYRVLPDELLHHFHLVFEQDQRGMFPQSLLENLHWSTCHTCGIEHARPHCPDCTPSRPAQPVAVPAQTVRGELTATQLFQTRGRIIVATAERQHLRWIYHQQGTFYRESGEPILTADYTPHLRWQIQGESTLLYYSGQVLRLQSGQVTHRTTVDARGNTCLFDRNEQVCYWVQNGQLYREEAVSRLGQSPTYMGDVLSSQTHFWVGQTFGFGFYRAGELQGAFGFDAQKPGISDRPSLPKLQGQLIDATCTFSHDYAWVFFTSQHQGNLHYSCTIVHCNGNVIASHHTSQHDQDWLAELGKGRSLTDPCLALATNHFLLAPTDQGIIRVELQNNQLTHTKTFTRTEPYVNSHSQILPAPQGLYIVNPQSIWQIVIHP
jgi:H/ACA ribonucleoprotein complex subunit 3